MGQTDIIIGTSEQPTRKLRICRMPGCLVSFDPAWRVRLPGEPAEADNLCPRCGAPLNRNGFIRRAQDGEEVVQEDDYELG
jgi:hypothetical protein